MYLPSYCTFRMTDVWRSFIAQRCLWELPSLVTFHASGIVQMRNEHNLMRDFKDEIPGYMENRGICDKLAQLSLQPGAAAVPGNLLACYEMLARERVFPECELPLVRAWLADRQAIHAGLKL